MLRICSPYPTKPSTQKPSGVRAQAAAFLGRLWSLMASVQVLPVEHEYLLYLL